MKIKYVGKGETFIPQLKSRPMGVVFPMKDYAKGGNLPDEEQIIEVTDKEGHSLIKQKLFKEVIAPKVAKTVKKEIE